MREVRRVPLVPWVLVLTFAFFAAHGDAGAAIYPSNQCASEKLMAAADTRSSTSSGRPPRMRPR
jgi:hypothetical protein